jgi:hypothetical protein
VKSVETTCEVTVAILGLDAQQSISGTGYVKAILDVP